MYQISSSLVEIIYDGERKEKEKKNFFLFKLKTFDITMSTYIS